MNLRAPVVHPLPKWFWFCVLVLVYIVFYVPYRNVDLQNTLDDGAEARKVEILNEYERNLNKNNESYTTEPLLNSTKRDTKSLYFVYSSKCKMPYVDPFAAEAMEIYKPQLFESCTNESDLVRPIYDMNRRRYVLQIDEKVAAEILKSSDTEYNCYYEEVTRDDNHDSYNVKQRKYFTTGYIVPLHVQFLMITCHTLENEKHIVQKDAFSLIQYKPRTEPKMPPSKIKPARKPSVIMFGIDSISRINLRRTMPRVYKFLTASGWYELQGYNKVGDNTFPNLMAILSGYTPETAEAKLCDTNLKGCFDSMPFIWKYFKNASYMTAYSEDWSAINTFNYLKPGFQKQPMDYYMRPFQIAIEDKMPSFECAGCSTRYCIGRRITSSYAYDFGKEFAGRYVFERPIWGLFWSSSFSHDDYAMPSKLEGNILQYLLDFESDGVLEESIFIFFSDHGSRYGSIMSLSSGFLEERLPMVFIYLPLWFRTKYPEYAEALELNRNRLSSNFDLHNTLKHIIELGGTPDGPALPKAHDCPNCQSLFYPLPEQRSCADAGISEHWCTCVPFKRLETKWSRRIAPLVINRMNDYLDAKNLTTLCVKLTLNYIHKTEIKIAPDMDWHNELPTMDVGVYRTKFKVQQNSADFMATIVFNNVTETVDVDVETISRTNSYENDSKCIDDKIAKLYCICADSLDKS